jgi:hypothetical protein
MATYNTAFGSLPGYNELLGTTNTTGGGQQQTYGQTTQTSTTRPPYQAAQTFAQMQRQGVARPAPPSAPQAQPFAQYGGSQQAQQMRQRLQSQLEQFGQTPSRFDTQAFQQIRGAQAANIRSEFDEQRRQLDEELARRGLSASNIAASGLGRLGGAQARALADIDAQLLQRAAETQAQDRAQLLSASQGLAELASAQDLAQFEANRVAQAATFENQLRAAQFGQQQFEQAGQEAFQGAQAEEAARQAERQFGLQATGQAAGLSMDLQRLLGQQEIERAGLTGQLGGMQTLAGRQFAEQQRQFDIQQALQAQLGLGGLGVQQAQLGLEQQRLAQQGQQFLAQLDEQQKARLQQGGFTTTELAIKRQQVDNELALQNRQLSETERNNLAIRGLQRDQFESEKDFRSQQLGLNRDELEQRANQIKEDQRLRGVEIDDQRAYRDAEIDLRTTQISNEYNIAGRQIDEQEARRLAEQDINDADNTAQMERLKAQITSQEKVAGADRAVQQTQLTYQNAARLSEQSGIQHTVGADGQVVPLLDAQGNFVRTSAETQAAEARKLQSEELTLRRQLGLMEATGQGLTVDAEGRLVPATGTGAQTLQARQLAYQNAARLSEQSGVQYTVKADGTVDVLRDAQGNPVRTSAFTQAEEARKQQQEQFTISQFGVSAPTAGQQTLAALQQRLQEAGITGKFGGELTQEALQNAYARAAQLTQATGQQYTVDPRTGAITAGGSTLEARLREAGITGTFGGALTQEALQNAYARAAQLSQITGQQYTVDPKDGKIVAATGEAGRTFAAQLQAAGITGQFGGELTQEALQNAYQRAAQLSQITGVQYDVDPKSGAITPKAGATAGTQAETLAAQLQKAGLTGTLGGQSTLERLQQNLQNAQIMSQITGRQFTVNEKGELVTTSTADTEARRQFDLEQQLRRQLGLTEASGYIYELGQGGLARTSEQTVQGQIARSQVLLSLANSLGNLTPEQIAQLLGKASPTSTPGGGGTPTTPPNTNDDGRLGAGQTELLQTLTAPDNPREGWLYNIGGTLVRYKSGKYYKMDGSIFTPGSTPTTPPNTPTTPPNTPTTPPNTPTTPPNTPTTPPTTPTTQNPTSTTPLTDSERQVVTSSLLGALFDGRYKYEPSLGGWVVYKGNNWYKYGATPPTQNITWNGQNMNVYPGYSTYYNGEILTWDGRTWITSSTTFS